MTYPFDISDQFTSFLLFHFNALHIFRHETQKNTPYILKAKGFGLRAQWKVWFYESSFAGSTGV